MNFLSIVYLEVIGDNCGVMWLFMATLYTTNTVNS